MNVLLLRDVVAVLLAGGAGERLYPLTRDRAKPAVPFGGPYRIIDFTLSNCINSGLRKIFMATQYKAQSLNRHVRMGWNVVNRELGEFVEILPPQKRVGEHWYLGTADAVYQNIYSIGSEHSRYVIVLSGDHIYKMNYQKMLQQHVDSGADATVATLEITPQEAAGRFGVIETDANWRIMGFEEKPQAPKRSHLHPDMINASMGV
jgi:glucose-1-phosphate adenylyltransferase